MRAARTLLAAMLASLLASCSTTRVLPEGQSRLSSTVVKVSGDRNFNASDLTPYLKQRAKSWTPGLCIYNWQDGKGKGWDKFVTRLGTPPVVFDSTLVATSCTNVIDHLEYLGYFNSVVTASVVRKKNRKVRTVYDVSLGKRYPIKKLEYDLQPSNMFIADYYADTVNNSIVPGTFLSESALEAETVRSAGVMRNKGYYDFSRNYFFFEADTVSVKDSCLLTLKIRQHTRNETEDADREFVKYRIGRVTVNYPENLKFRNKVLQDLNNLNTGDVFSDRKVNLAYSRFSNVSLFNNVSVRLQPKPDRTVDCEIRLQKSKTQGFKLGLEASVNTSGLFGISPELSYFHRNIFHGGEILKLSLTSNHQLKFNDRNVHSNDISASASLTFPRFLPFSTKKFRGPNLPKTEVSATYNYQDRPEFVRHIFSTSFGYLGNLHRKFSYQAKLLSFSLLRLGRVDSAFIAKKIHNYYLMNSLQDHLDLGVNGSLYYNSAGVSNPDKSSWYARVQMDLSGNLLSAFKGLMPQTSGGIGLLSGIPFSQYVRGELSVGKTFVFGNRSGQSFAMRFLMGLGYAYGNSSVLPYEKAFFSGGANSLRGWTARTVGPGCSPLDTFWSIPNQTGNMKLEANLEYRFDIFWRLEGALFVDAGNIWMLGEEFGADVNESYFHFKSFAKAIAADWGLGLRLDLSFLLLRVDFGMRFHDPARTDSKWLGPVQWFRKGNFAFHFGVGYPF